MTNINENELLASVESKLKADGWEKNAYELYKFMDKERQFIVGLTFETSKKHKNIISATARFYSVFLNELSHFFWHYEVGQNPYHGTFRRIKLPIGRHLHGYDNCSLFRTKAKVDVSSNDPDLIVQACNREAHALYERYKNIDDLIKEHDCQGKYNGSAMLMYMAKNDYEYVLRLFRADETFPPVGGGDVKLGLWTYLKRNILPSDS